MTAGQYRLVRFVPDPARDEPVNIGIVMTGVGAPLVAFPDEALERASRWCRALDLDAFVDLRLQLVDWLRRDILLAEDTGRWLDRDFLGESFGPITLSAPRWVDLDQNEAGAAVRLFEYLTERLVRPPKPVVYGGGAGPGEKLAREVLVPAIKSVLPNAMFGHRLIGRSGREFVADVFCELPTPMLISAMVLSSSPQAIHAMEAKAFEMYDVGRSLSKASMTAFCKFPPVDPKHVKEEAYKIFESIDVRVVTPDHIDAVLESR